MTLDICIWQVAITSRISGSLTHLVLTWVTQGILFPINVIDRFLIYLFFFKFYLKHWVGVLCRFVMVGGFVYCHLNWWVGSIYCINIITFFRVIRLILLVAMVHYFIFSFSLLELYMMEYFDPMFDRNNNIDKP